MQSQIARASRAFRRETSYASLAALSAQKKSASIRAARAREVLADAARVAEWVASRQLAPPSSSALTAAERREALRCRVRLKEQNVTR
jgi:hypothetical protein